MGGSKSARGNVTPSAEFNFHADPEAARAVLEGAAGRTETVLVPWETCHDRLVSDVRGVPFWGDFFTNEKEITCHVLTSRIN